MSNFKKSVSLLSGVLIIISILMFWSNSGSNNRAVVNDIVIPESRNPTSEISLGKSKNKEPEILIRGQSKTFHSIEHYKDEFENKNDDELTQISNSIDSKVSKLRLIERANSESLSLEELNAFGDLLAKRAAAKLISIRRRLSSHT